MTPLGPDMFWVPWTGAQPFPGYHQSRPPTGCPLLSLLTRSGSVGSHRLVTTMPPGTEATASAEALGRDDAAGPGEFRFRTRQIDAEYFNRFPTTVIDGIQRSMGAAGTAQIQSMRAETFMSTGPGQSGYVFLSGLIAMSDGWTAVAVRFAVSNR